MALISVTRLRVRSFRYLPGFIFLALRSYRRLITDGRRSKVNHPSSDQQAYRFPPPAKPASSR